MFSRYIYFRFGILLFAMGLACAGMGCLPAHAQVTEIAAFAGDDSESFEAFPNYNQGGFHFLASPAPVLNGSATLASPEMVVCESNQADVVLGLSGPVQVADGSKGLALDNFASTATLTFASPVLQFGGCWAGYTQGSPATITLDFYDTAGQWIDTVSFSYDHSDTMDGGMDWHGWASSVPIGRVVITGDYVVMDGLQTQRAFATVSGTLTLEGIVPTAAAQAITFTFRSIGFPDEVRMANVGPSGIFSLTGLPRRPFTLHSKGSKYLAANVAVNTTGGNVSGVTAVLRAGDATGDNTVNFDDFQVLADAYFTTGGVDVLYNAQADFNGDGEVNFDDFLLLAGNYFVDGDG